MLALWLDEALHDAAVTQEAFVEMVERYGEVLRFAPIPPLHKI